MTDDPILLSLTAFFLIVIPVFSFQMGKVRSKRVFLLPALAMCISFPIFMFLMVVPDTPYSIYFFYASMSLWTGGFFGIFFSLYFYSKRNRSFRRKR
ncbi:MAG: hypothetical protein ABH890_07335 [Bacillota bacterium]